MDDADLPRTLVDWRWSESLPNWIDGTEPGSILIENRAILDITVKTYLSVGEIILAFGLPDKSWLVTASSRNFEHSLWYAARGVQVSIEGYCPTRSTYDLPATIRFRSDAPRSIEIAPVTSICW